MWDASALLERRGRPGAVDAPMSFSQFQERSSDIALVRSLCYTEREQEHCASEVAHRNMTQM